MEIRVDLPQNGKRRRFLQRGQQMSIRENKVNIEGKFNNPSNKQEK